MGDGEAFPGREQSEQRHRVGSPQWLCLAKQSEFGLAESLRGPAACKVWPGSWGRFVFKWFSLRWVEGLQRGLGLILGTACVWEKAWPSVMVLPIPLTRLHLDSSLRPSCAPGTAQLRRGSRQRASQARRSLRSSAPSPARSRGWGSPSRYLPSQRNPQGGSPGLKASADLSVLA